MLMRSVVFLLVLLLSGHALGQSLWEQVPSPNPSPYMNWLRGISGVTTNAIWTVGNIQETPQDQPLITTNLVLRWNGASWDEHAVQNFSNNYNVLWDVHALSDDDVWAIGDYNAGGGNARPQVHHWDGAVWNSSALVPPGGGGAFLRAMDASASDDIWAVGGEAMPNVGIAYLIHWNGSGWTSHDAPIIGTWANRLNDVSVLSANDAWAVGEYENAIEQLDRFLVFHWNGSEWDHVPLPAPYDSMLGALNDVKALAPDDVWVAGRTLALDPIVLHWNGSNWSEVPTGGLSVRAFAPLAPDHMFAFGSAIVHWNGSDWSVSDALADHPYPSLMASTVLPDGSIWAAGNVADIDGVTQTLVYHRGPGGSTAIDPDVEQGAGPVIYPNPFTEKLTIRGNRPEAYEVIIAEAATGRQVFQFTGPTAQKVDLHLASLAAGAYLVKVSLGEVVHQTLVIKQ